jgi:hypothetical protein
VQDEAQEEAKRLQGQVDGISAQQADLKAVLYAKFGDTINLEE